VEVNTSRIYHNINTGYSWHNEEFLYKGLIYISKQLALKSKVLSEFHASPTARHSGFKKLMNGSSALSSRTV
jgi:hypothetical protein